MAQSSAIFLFLRYCLEDKVDLSMVVSNMDWRQLYSFATKQTIIGICFDGIKRLSEEYPEELKKNPIERDLLMTWMGVSQQIRRQNMKVNGVAAKLYSMLREDGLRCCILKGQGNTLIYPNAYSRNPGDIDVWVNASREQITEYAKKHFELGDDIRYQHIETSVDGVPVELHFFPCTMNNPIYNARLQKWFKRNADLQCSNVVSLPDGIGEIAIPTMTFNVVYQLTHLYHHFFDEGIGMRQIIDYFLVVNDFSKNVFLNNKSSKITPSLFILKEGSTSHPDPLTLRGEGGNRPTRCSEPLRSKVGGPSKVFARLCGMGPPGEREFTIFNLQLIVYRLLIMAHGDGLLGGTTIFVPHRSIALRSSPLEWGIFFKYSAFYRREIKSSAVCSVTISTENQRLPKSFRDAPK